MITLLLCDDDAADLARVEAMVREYYGEAVTMHAYASPEEAMRYVEAGGSADIALLDIIMPEMTGVALAQRLRAQGFDGYIAFLTTTNDYAAESYQVNAFGYLLKPVGKAALFALLERVNVAAATADPCFSVKQGKRIRKVLFSQFMYMEVRDHRLYFHLDGGEVLDVYATFAEYMPVLLREARCGRCHKSLIVNMDHVECLDGKVIRMHDGRQLPISRNFLDFRAAYLRWAFVREGEA